MSYFWKTFFVGKIYKTLKINLIENFLKNFRKPRINFVVRNNHITFARILPLVAIPY